MANFFIDRPIFAWVLAILLCLTGTLAIFSLPVEQYPDLAPPNVRVTANYPGASAQTLENTVTQVIEQNMTGLDNLMYMSSQSSGTGQASVTLSFKAGTDPDEAVQQVQNQLQSAMRKLPQAVQNQGVTVRKTGDTNILTIAFVSTDGSMDKQDIADYVASNIQDPLSRVNGVGDIDAYGSQYSMRIWLDPAKLNSFQMTAKDVTDAIESQNAQIAVGQLGGTPSVDKQALNATINAQSLLQTPEQFRDITLRVNQDGSEVRLGDVATVEMGAEKYDYLSRFNGKPASGLGVKLASGANEMATAELVLNRLDELAQYFPHGLEYKVAYETTSFVKASIEDVVKTLLEAIALVFLVMYLFLDNFHKTFIFGGQFCLFFLIGLISVYNLCHKVVRSGDCTFCINDNWYLYACRKIAGILTVEFLARIKRDGSVLTYGFHIAYKIKLFNQVTGRRTSDFRAYLFVLSVLFLAFMGYEYY